MGISSSTSRDDTVTARRLLTRLLITLPLLAGCGRVDLKFNLSNDTKDLDPTPRELVRQAIDQSFGSPDDLVALEELPIDFGTITGTVRPELRPGPDETSPENIDRIKVSLDGDLPDELANVTLLLEGTAEPIPVRRFNAVTGVLTLNAQIPFAMKPAGGTRLTIHGHKLQEGRLQYMQHCMHCHGVNGNGNGPTVQSATRNNLKHRFSPLPRDYRRGLFKFTSTKGGFRARRDDLKRTIQFGLAGTYMPSFRLLEDDKLDAIVEYVRWLAMRGELERRLNISVLSALAGNPNPATLETLFAEAFDEAKSDIIADWTDAEDPGNVIWPTIARVADTPASRMSGRTEFLNTKINCQNCHGPAARGNGDFLLDYHENKDTKEPYKVTGLHDAWHNPITPRDLTSGIFRGGRRPIDIFRRMTAGVKGTPMAGFPSLSEEKRWDLVNYVLSIPVHGALAPVDPPHATRTAQARTSRTATP